MVLQMDGGIKVKLGKKILVDQIGKENKEKEECPAYSKKIPAIFFRHRAFIITKRRRYY